MEDSFKKAPSKFVSIAPDASQEHYEEERSSENVNPYSMTEDILKKRLNRKMYYTGRKITQIYTCLVVSMGHLNFGTCLGWASPMIFHEMNSSAMEHPVKSNEFAEIYTWITSMVPLGASVGLGLWSIFSYKKGPRKTLLIQSVFYFIFLILTSLLKRTNQLVILGRFFIGFFGVCYLVCGQMLMTDSIHAKLLKYMRIPPQVSILIGVSSIQLIALYDKNSYIARGFCVGITVIAFLMLLVVPESPVHLFQQGEKLAEKSLQWYIGKSSISYTMRRIRRQYDYRRIGMDEMYMLALPIIRKTIIILIGVVVLQISSGYYMYLFYGTLLWSGKPLIDPFTDVWILGCVLTFSRAFWMLVHLKLNIPVRQPLMLSCTIVGTSQFALASILFIRSRELCKDTDFVKWTCFVCIFFMVNGFEMGLNHYIGSLVYMYLPVQIYQTGLTIVNAAFWFLLFLTIKCNGLWYTWLPSWQLFLIMSIFTLLGTIYVYVFVVEVFNKSLVQIQLDIGGSPVGNRDSISVRTGAEEIL